MSHVEKMVMGSSSDQSPWYGAYYFRTYREAPYDRSAKWLGVFGRMADGIVREIGPRSVLDAGCAMGLLVEALRDRGVEAWGFDISPFAISHVRDDVKPYCRIGSILDDIPERCDLVVCHEVIEHLPAADAARAMDRLCEVTDDVLFASTPDAFEEDTHLNVQPPEYWTGLFARLGFIRDLDFDGTAFLSPWACRFRRNADPLHRVVSAYERRLWALSKEVTALRTRGLETAAVLARQEQELHERADVVRLGQTIEEQQEHLDALNDRLRFMSDHETELLRLLFDAHQQLLERDGMLQSQPLQSLQALVDERTAWAQRSVAELEECRTIALERQRVIEERTAWAQRADADLEAYRRSRFPLLTALRRRLRGVR